MSGALTAMHKKTRSVWGFYYCLCYGCWRRNASWCFNRKNSGWLDDESSICLRNYFRIFLAIIFRKKFDKLRTSLFLFDTIGLGVFTLIGLEKGITTGLHPVICVALGTMTACFGGVIRDILCNEIPTVFKKKSTPRFVFLAELCSSDFEN